MAKSKLIVTGTSGYDTREVIIVNPSDADWTRHRFVLWFGPEYLMIWANGLEDALEIACDWALDHAPGIFCDEQVEELIKEKLAEIEAEEGPMPARAPEGQAWLFPHERALAEANYEREEQRRHTIACEYAEADTTMFGHNGIHYIASDQWGVCLEDPTRAELLSFLDPKHPKLKAKDALVEVARKAMRSEESEENESGSESGSRIRRVA